MNLITRAKFLRKIIEQLAETLDDTEALESKELFPTWDSETNYNVDDRVRYNGALYKCLQSHTAQDSWSPDVAVSLWAEVLIPDPEVIPDWVQPGSTNPYMKGDKVRYDGKIWVSDIDNNVWAPGVYGWSELLE